MSPDVQGFNPNDSFAANKCAMVGAGHYAMQTFDQAGFKDYDIVPWPRKTTGTTVFSGAGWGISQGSQHPDLAWELIKEFSGPTTQLDKAKAGVNEPVSKTALNSPEFLSHPAHASLFFEVIPSAEPAANPVFFNDLELILHAASRRGDVRRQDRRTGDGGGTRRVDRSHSTVMFAGPASIPPGPVGDAPSVAGPKRSMAREGALSGPRIAARRIGGQPTKKSTSARHRQQDPMARALRDRGEEGGEHRWICETFPRG